MAVQINNPDPDMMKEGKGWLSYKWQLGIMALLRCIFTGSHVSVPPGYGSGKFIFGLDNWVLDLTNFKTPPTRHALEIYQVSDGVNIVNGTVGGLLADSTMGATEFNIPLADLVFADNYICAEMDTEWDANDIVNSITGAGTIGVYDGATPDGDDSVAYCLIGIVHVAAGVITGITQTASGSQTCLREGEPAVAIWTWFGLQ